MCKCRGANKKGKAKRDEPVELEKGPKCSTPDPPPPEQPPPPIGTLVLTKLAFSTTYNVCSDDVENFGDYKNFYILEDGGYYSYHWLKDRKNVDDKTKPANLPFTLTGQLTLKCMAFFKVEGDPLPGSPTIKIDKSSGSKYEFDEHTGNASGEFQKEFKATNFPYKDTIDHIANFELDFLYSNDGGGTWLNAGKTSNEFYITWKPFDLAALYADTGPTDREKKTMQLQCDKTGAKKYILETLLYLGCSGAKGKGKDEAEILDAIFPSFEGLSLNPKRKTFVNGMGYWRDTSSAVPSPPSDFGTLRSIRYLLKIGEARCGEWTEFFNHVAFTQGITSMSQVPVATSEMHDPGAPDTSYDYTPYDTNHPTASAKKDTTLATYTPFLLLVKTCDMQPQTDTITKLPTEYIENFGKSKAQGNDDAVNIFQDHVFSRHDGSKRFFDASYGAGKSIFPDEANSVLENYCKKMLDGILFKKAGGANHIYIRHYGGNLEVYIDYKIVTTDQYVYLFVLHRPDVT